MFTIVLNEINLERHHCAFGLTILKVESKKKKHFYIDKFDSVNKILTSGENNTFLPRV